MSFPVSVSVYLRLIVSGFGRMHDIGQPNYYNNTITTAAAATATDTITLYLPTVMLLFRADDIRRRVLTTDAVAVLLLLLLAATEPLQIGDAIDDDFDWLRRLLLTGLMLVLAVDDKRFCNK